MISGFVYYIVNVNIKWSIFKHFILISPEKSAELQVIK